MGSFGYANGSSLFVFPLGRELLFVVRCRPDPLCMNRPFNVKHALGLQINQRDANIFSLSRCSFVRLGNCVPFFTAPSEDGFPLAKEG